MFQPRLTVPVAAVPAAAAGATVPTLNTRARAGSRVLSTRRRRRAEGTLRVRDMEGYLAGGKGA
ncbi:hypothetical protein GCM10009544_03000 [Streptomyces stramineus]|uniref:FXSXX-COOH protein n=1 Tax=Streptomyces stramineus TaxID=173861 RepID=A0ABN0ZCQ4_9ACTN